MSAVDKFPVFPTPMSRQLMKYRLSIAEKGYTILKKKSEVLQLKYRKVGQEIVDIKILMGQIMRDASYLLAETKYIVGDFSHDILNRVGKARLKVTHRIENVAGVNLRIFDCYTACKDQYGLAGLAKGGARLALLKRTYGDATEILVQLATLQTAFKTLDDIIKSTNRRVNALEYRYIPRVLNTIAYIDTELDEKERQEYFRLKKIKKKKMLERQKMDELIISLKEEADSLKAQSRKE